MNTMVHQEVDTLIKINKQRFYLLAWLLLLVSFLGCQSSKGTDASQHVSLNQNIPTKRIVVIGPPLYLEIINAYGDLHAVIAVANAPNLPKEAQSLPKVGSSLLPNLEAIISHQPTLVIGGLQILREKLPKNILFFPGETLIQTLDHLKNLIRQIGVVLGKEQHQITKVLSDFDARLQKQTSRITHCTKKSVAVLLLSSASDLYTIGTPSIEHELFSLAGGNLVITERFPGKPISMELLFSQNPEILFTDVSMLPRMTQDARLLKLSALQKNQVFGVRMADFVSTKAPELLGSLIDLLHQKDPSLCLTSLKTSLSAQQLTYEN